MHCIAKETKNPARLNMQGNLREKQIIYLAISTFSVMTFSPEYTFIK